MPPKTDKENETDEELKPGEGDQSTDTPPQEPADKDKPESKKPSDWETSYKGLQKVVGNKNKELETMQAKVDALAVSLEEYKTDATSKETVKGDLDKTLKETQDKLTSLQTEKDGLDQQLVRQNIVMADYPDLVPLAEYIPAADDADAFKENAKQFAEAIKGFVDTGVKIALKGSSPKQPPGTDELPSEDEKNKLWEKAAALAGVPGKEKEYEEAMQEYMGVLKAEE